MRQIMPGIGAMSKFVLIIAVLVAVFVAGMVRAAPPRTIVVAQSTTQPAATVASASVAPADLATALDEQLSRLLRGQPILGEAELAGLSPEDRELTTDLIEAVASFRTSARTTTTINEKAKPLVVLGEQIKQRAALAVANLALCESVDRYGVYEPIAASHLQAGAETPVILYCEVENFRPKLNAKGLWETRLSYELALYPDSTVGGLAAPPAVFTKPAATIIDRCRNQRRDFFVADRVTLPATLSAGKYVMKVIVKDLQAQRVGEATLGVEVVGRGQAQSSTR
jgi:hypothetical protein